MVKRTTVLIFIVACLFFKVCGKNKANEIITLWETGRSSLLELRQEYPECADITTFLNFIDQFWYGYNLNPEQIYNRTLQDIRDKESTWYHTAKYMYHSQTKELGKDSLNTILDKAQKARKSSDNFYIHINNFFNELNHICDSSELLAKTQIGIPNLQHLNFYKFHYSSMLRNIGMSNKALETASKIQYKDRLDITRYLVGSINVDLGNVEIFRSELSKIINETGNVNYSLEVVLNLLFSGNSLDSVFKLFQEHSGKYLRNTQYYIVEGYLHQSSNNLDLALESFHNAFMVSGFPQDLEDYIWLNITLNKFENVQRYMDAPSFQELDWFKAYKIIFLISTASKLDDALHIYMKSNDCSRLRILEYLEPYEQIIQQLGLD